MAHKPGRAELELERVTQAVLDGLGFELVELEKAGHRARPILRIRIDRADSEPGRGVTVDDCARVSRELEAVLDERADLPSSYILEVSSPGVERPLRKRRHFERCLGREVAVSGFSVLADGSKRVRGTLLAVEGAEGAELIRLRLANGAEIEIPIDAIAKAHLVFDWDRQGLAHTKRKKA